jgi:hypothetical protein
MLLICHRSLRSDRSDLWSGPCSRLRWDSNIGLHVAITLGFAIPSNPPRIGDGAAVQVEQGGPSLRSNLEGPDQKWAMAAHMDRRLGRVA